MTYALRPVVIGASLPQRRGSTTRLERGSQRNFAGFEDFESAAPIGAGGEFQEDRVAASRNLQSGWRVAVEFIVDENFGAVRIGRNGYRADAIGNGRRGGACGLGRVTGFGQSRLSRGRSSRMGGSDIRIEAAKDIKQVGGAESKTDPIGIFLDELQRVDADDFPARVEERAAAVAGIDGSIGLNPGAPAGIRKLSNGADDPLGDAEQHGITGIANGEHALALTHAARVGEGEVWEINLRGRAFHFSQGDIELRINVNDFGLDLLPAGEQRKQGFFAASDVSVGDQYARTRNEKSRAGFVQGLQINDGGLGLTHQLLER